MKHQIILILLFVVCNQLVSAQEITLGTPQLYKPSSSSKHKDKNIPHLKVGKIRLPFWDDFSYSGTKPNSNLWMEQDVTVNTGYAVNPITIGVATFDALDSTGKVYANANYKTSVIGDHLTSKPIDLDGSTNKDVFLSFYFEPQGNGEMPDAQDSLVLEFYSPNQRKWFRQWSTPGALDTVKFTHVILPIQDTTFLKTGFQFRFYNYFSLSSSIIPSLASNCDHWNLDYVYLNSGRSLADTIYHDIAFIQPITSILNNYESVPWRHFLEAKGTAMQNSIPFYLRNNDNVKRSIDQSRYEIREALSGKLITSRDGGQSNINATTNLKILETYDNTQFPFTDNKKDSAIFVINAEIGTDNFDSTINNKNTYSQKFFDYYAYDDGSAELGYGLIGEGASRAMCAYQFTPLIKDTLTAVNINFNQSFLNASKQYFNLTIWDASGEDNKPGKIIYKEQNYRPVYASKKDSFETYYLKAHTSGRDTALVLSGTYYVGWIQTTADFLNIGFDINRNSSEHLFFNMGDGWAASSKKGALMLRPMYRKKRIITDQPVIEAKHSSVYPNPTSNTLTIKTEDDAIYRLGLFDAIGRSVVSSTMQNGETQLDVSNLNCGFYILKIIGSNKTTETVKVIISR